VTGIWVPGYSVRFVVARLQVHRAYTTFSNPRIEIRRRAEDGAGWEWHSVAHSPE